jgi:hypothetical protein
VRALVVIAIAGCARSEPALSHHTSSNPAELAAKADAAFAASLAPDYRQPFAAAGIDPSPVRAQYLDACAAGDSRSCWVARSLAHGLGGDSVANDLLRRHCRDGDRTSCRALTRFRGDDLPGHTGRTCQPLVDCERHRAALDAECAAGFPHSCLAAAYDRLATNGAGIARAVDLAANGCQRGILEECSIVLEHEHDPRRWIAAATRTCELSSDDCVALGRRQLRDGKPAEARDAYERQCQHTARSFGAAIARRCSPATATTCSRSRCPAVVRRS